jgi:hypothetical protein
MKTLLTLLLSISLSSIALAGNSVFIEQIGTSTDSEITIDIDGNNNAVNLTMEGTNNELDITQEGNNNTVSWISYWGSGKAWGGDLDGNNNNIKFEQYNTTGSDSNRIGFHMPGNSNELHICQGATFSSSTDTTCSGTTPNSEYGGHTVNLDVHANGNSIKVGQETGTGNADHYAQIYYFGGDNNDTFLTQKGNGNKTLNMIVRTDGGEQELMQKGDGAHTATIDLTGSYHTDMSMTQQGNTAQSYSLTQNCQTSGGCSVSVTQGN